MGSLLGPYLKGGPGLGILEVGLLTISQLSWMVFCCCVCVSLSVTGSDWWGPNAGPRVCGDGEDGLCSLR